MGAGTPNTWRGAGTKHQACGNLAPENARRKHNKEGPMHVAKRIVSLVFGCLLMLGAARKLAANGGLNSGRLIVAAVVDEARMLRARAYLPPRLYR